MPALFLAVTLYAPRPTPTPTPHALRLRPTPHAHAHALKPHALRSSREAVDNHEGFVVLLGSAVSEGRRRRRRWRRRRPGGERAAGAGDRSWSSARRNRPRCPRRRRSVVGVHHEPLPRVEQVAAFEGLELLDAQQQALPGQVRDVAAGLVGQEGARMPRVDEEDEPVERSITA